MRCRLCGSEARLAYSGLPGYQAGGMYDIYDCGGCLSRFAWPLAADENLYESIYAHASEVPGYARYQAYAEEVRKAAAPLDLLAAKEESYWATAEVLRRKRRALGRNLRVLDVGSGLGYLTYALSRDGFDAHGVDSSARAVSGAQSMFGPLYENARLSGLAAKGEAYDAVLMNQMLEHVPEARELLEEAMPLLKPGGALLVTTPNRSFAAAGTVWDTDLPPVHCWWFSEGTFRYLSGELRAELEILDFSEFYASHYVRNSCGLRPPEGRKPFIGADGLPLPGIKSRPADWLLETAASRLGLRGPYRALRDGMTGVGRLSGPRGPVCCAVFTRPA